MAYIIKKLKISEIHWAIGLLAIVTFLTYGVLITRLGFYHDDWYFLWTGQFQGLSGIISLFQIDRPLIGWIYALDYVVLPATPLAWQFLGLLERFAGILAFLWLMRILWPGQKIETMIATLLFAVYPGYLQQPNATTFSNLLIAEAAVLFSFVFTLKALRADSTLRRASLLFLSGLLALIYLGIFEVMIGLEGVRLLLIWFERRRSNGGSWFSGLKRASLAYIPYLLLAFIFLIWRLFIFKSTRHATNVDLLFSIYSTEKWRAPFVILIETFKDMVETAVFAWIVPFYQFTARDNYHDLVIGLSLGATVAFLVFLYIRGRPHEMNADPQPRHIESLWMGILMLFLTLLPVDTAGRNVLFSDQWDRYTFHAAIGVCFFITGLVFYALRGTVRKIVILTLIASSVVAQYHSAAFYRNFWTTTRNLWWQMSWRAPQIKPQTMLFVPGASFGEGYEIYGPANIIYNPRGDLVIGADVLNADTLTRIIKQDPRSHYDRSVLVQDHYENPLIGVFPTPNSCLHLLSNRKIELPGYIDDSLVVHAAEYSKIDRVDVSASPRIPPVGIFGSEPPHDWCFYYEKMDLARQRGNWQETARLADEANNRDLTPNDLSEWMPAFEAYASTGDLKDARHVASILRSDENTRLFLCLQLDKGPAYPSPYNYDLVRQLLCHAG